MITNEQIVQARQLLNWTPWKLARNAKVPVATVRRAERIGHDPLVSFSTLAKIQQVLEQAGVEFIPENGGGGEAEENTKPRLRSVARRC